MCDSSPLLFPVNTYGCHPFPFSSQPTVAVMLIYPLSYSICHASSSRSCPILSSPLPYTERSCSFCIRSWQNCCFFLLTLPMLIQLPDMIIMSWSSVILYNDQVGRLCITLINKWCHATFKKEKKKKKKKTCLRVFFYVLVVLMWHWPHCNATTMIVRKTIHLYGTYRMTVSVMVKWLKTIFSLKPWWEKSRTSEH